VGSKSKNIQISYQLFHDIIDLFDVIDSSGFLDDESILYNKVMDGLYEKLERLNLREHYVKFLFEDDVYKKNQARLAYARLKLKSFIDKKSFSG
jgi:hypothetical protein